MIYMSQQKILLIQKRRKLNYSEPLYRDCCTVCPVLFLFIISKWRVNPNNRYSRRKKKKIPAVLHCNNSTPQCNKTIVCTFKHSQICLAYINNERKLTHCFLYLICEILEVFTGFIWMLQWNVFLKFELQKQLCFNWSFKYISNSFEAPWGLAGNTVFVNRSNPNNYH